MVMAVGKRQGEGHYGTHILLHVGGTTAVLQWLIKHHKL